MSIDSAAPHSPSPESAEPQETPAAYVPETPLSMARDGLRVAGRFTGRLIRGHKIASGAVAVFVAAAIAVSLVTTGGTAPKVYPKAPAFTIAVLGKTGQNISLSQYAGKPVILNFWASWCTPCQQETPLLAKWYKQQGGHVVLLGLDENDTAADAEKFAAAKGISYPVGFDPETIVAGLYSVDDLPQTFFLNAKHEIVDHLYGAVTTAELNAGTKLMDAS